MTDTERKWFDKRTDEEIRISIKNRRSKIKQLDSKLAESQRQKAGVDCRLHEKEFRDQIVLAVIVAILWIYSDVIVDFLVSL